MLRRRGRCSASRVLLDTIGNFADGCADPAVFRDVIEQLEMVDIHQGALEEKTAARRARNTLSAGPNGLIPLNGSSDQTETSHARDAPSPISPPDGPHQIYQLTPRAGS